MLLKSTLEKGWVGEAVGEAVVYSAALAATATMFLVAVNLAS